MERCRVLGLEGTFYGVETEDRPMERTYLVNWASYQESASSLP